MQPSAKALLLAAAILAGPIPARAEAPTDPAPPDFVRCLGELKTLAEERGVSRTVAETALSGVAPDPSVVPATQSQAEFVKPVWEYIEASVTPERIATGSQGVM